MNVKLLESQRKCAKIGNDRLSVDVNPLADGTRRWFGRYSRRVGGASFKTAMALAVAVAAMFAGGQMLTADAAAATVPAAAPAKPDIVYILVDDMGYGDVSIDNPGDRIQTPNIDSIGRDGMVFTDAHAAAAVCHPSRYGILTGRYGWRSWEKDQGFIGISPPMITPGRMTVASLLKAHGYNTAMIGKWGVGVNFQFRPNAQNKGNGRDITDISNSRALAAYMPGLDQTPKKNGLVWRIDYNKRVLNGPLTDGFTYDDYIVASADECPWIYFKDDRPVGAATVRLKIDKQLMGADFSRIGPAAPYYKPDEVLPYFTKQGCSYIRKQAAARHPFFLYLALPSPHTPLAPTPEFRGKSPFPSVYLDYCIEVDAMVGRVLHAIKKAGIANHTMVIFTSDNGFAPYVDPHHYLERNGDYPNYIFRGYKFDIWDGGQRVPFLVRWPGVVKPGSVNKDVISLTDLMATAADILHVHLPANAGVDSVSILPALKGGQVSHPIVVASVNGSLGIRDGRWMLIMCPGSGGWTLPNPVARRDDLPPVQLYDFDTWLGLTEQLNVEAEHPNVVRRLRSLLVRYIRDGRSTPGAPQHNANPQVWPQINWIKSIGPDAIAAHRQQTTAGSSPRRPQNFGGTAPVRPENAWWYY